MPIDLRSRTCLLAATVLSMLACAPRDTADPAADPPADEEAHVEVGAVTAAPGSSVEIRARGFSPDALLEIGFGQPRSDYSVIQQAESDPQGALYTMITIPDWAMRGMSYVVVVTAPDHDPRAVSEPFVVGAAGDTVRVQGPLEQGVECPAIRHPFGALFTLAARDLEYGPGTEVRVVGTIAEMSFCMQGTTLNVVSIERL